MTKCGYHGTCHKMSPRHLSRYTDQFSGHHNIHDRNTIDQMGLVVRDLEGTRLTCNNKLNEPTRRHSGGQS